MLILNSVRPNITHRYMSNFLRISQRWYFNINYGDLTCNFFYLLFNTISLTYCDSHTLSQVHNTQIKRKHYKHVLKYTRKNLKRNYLIVRTVG